MAELKYRTFDQLMNQVNEDLHLYADNNLIIPRRYIETVRTVNADLGIRLNQTKETILQVKDYKAPLPENLLSITLVMATSIKSMGFLGYNIPGTQIRIYNREEIISKFGPNYPPGCKNSCGDCYWVTRTYQDKEILYQDVYPLKPTPASFSKFAINSPNRTCDQNEYFIDVTDEEIIVNFCDGEIYITYLSDLVDEDNNILILDHPLVNDYYRWAVVKKVFEDLWHNTEADVERKYVNARDVELPPARRRAQGIVTTPEYSEINKHTAEQIKKFYDRYIKIFV